MSLGSRRHLRAGSFCAGLLGCFACCLAAFAVPAWWRAGRPRTMHRSYAEVELLSQLAVVLMPTEPIGELFRDFPVEPSEVWGARWLCPDITAHGVLKRVGAAFFVEYDGHPCHYAAEGLRADKRKTRALLKHSPLGSRVLRIGHVRRCSGGIQNSTEATVDVWRRGHRHSLSKAVNQAVCAVAREFAGDLQPDVLERLQATLRMGDRESSPSSYNVDEFVRQARLTSNVESQKADMYALFKTELGLSKSRMEALADKFPRIWGVNIHSNLKPAVAWLEDVGLSRAQVAKVVAGFPAVLGLSIEGNLRPTVAWLEDVGLSPAQVAKVVAAKPQVLGYSIEGNLRPTVAWLEDVGLSPAQVAKVVAGFPAVLGYSIEDNLRPTVAWLEDVGLSPAQVAKVVAAQPQVLGLSIEGNLRPTVAWLEDVGLSPAQVAKVVAGFPAVLGLSIEGNLRPTVAWLEDVGLSRAQVAKVVAGFPAVLGYSIEGNLRPTVAWLEDVGLSRAEVAKVVAIFPSVLGLSIERNLSRKVAHLLRYFSSQQICSMLVYHPPILGYSYSRLHYRVGRLEQCDCLAKLAQVMSFTDARFDLRFNDPKAEHHS